MTKAPTSTKTKKDSTEISVSLKSTEHNQATVMASVAQSLVKKEREKTLEHMAAHVTIKGFRQGKAPLNLVKSQLDPQKIAEHTLDHIFPHILKKILEEHQFELLSYPKAKIIKLPDYAPWEFEINLPLKPKVELGDYRKVVQQASPPKIIIPGQEQKENKDEQERLPKIFDALLKQIAFEVPPMLIEEEVSHSLSRLLQQTESLGLKIDDYLKSINKTIEQLREDYSKAASDNLKIELILDLIGKDLNVEISQTEIDAMIDASGDTKVKKDLDTDSKRSHISAILRQRKTLEALLKL